MRTQTKDIQTHLTPEKALDILVEGNRRFVSNLRVNRNLLQQVNETSSGQFPFAIVLSCIDSRTSAELIFDQGLGDMFVVRTAGHVIDSAVLGSIEYAVDHLHSPLIMVMGHSSCGAITAVSQGVKLHGHVASLTPPIDAALKRTKGRPGCWTDNAAKELALAMARKIEESEPVIADMVQAGKVLVVATYYDLHTGEVTLLSEGVLAPPALSSAA